MEVHHRFEKVWSRILRVDQAFRTVHKAEMHDFSLKSTTAGMLVLKLMQVTRLFFLGIPGIAEVPATAP